MSEKQLIRPYGDRKDDGVIQLSFVLPVPASEKAKEAAAQVAKKLGLSHVLVAAYRERGFKATKLRIGLGPVGWADGPRDQTRDRVILERARALLGPDFAIGADTDKTYDHAMAARLAPLVQELDLAWFEEPLPNLEREQYVREMLRLREVVRVPLSGGQGFFVAGKGERLIRDFRQQNLAGIEDSRILDFFAA